jgi:ribosome-associated translation inhibitor RaiA
MQIQINTDNHIQGSQEFSNELTESIQNSLSKFESYITRVEVFLKDENSIKGGSDDKKCSIEVRIEGAKPVGVTNNGATLREAFNGATLKLNRVVGDMIDQMKAHQ